MTEEEKKTLRQKIVATIAAHRENIAALEYSIAQLPPVDDVDRATRTEIMNYKRNCEAQIRGALQKIAKLESATKRVDSPDYGICIECEKPIEMEKLKLIPDTLYCVQCHKL